MYPARLTPNRKGKIRTKVSIVQSRGPIISVNFPAGHKATKEVAEVKLRRAHVRPVGRIQSIEGNTSRDI